MGSMSWGEIGEILSFNRALSLHHQEPGKGGWWSGDPKSCSKGCVRRLGTYQNIPMGAVYVVL